MTLPTPSGPVTLADSIRDLSARRHSLFHQAWAREIGLGSDMYEVDGHFARLGLFLRHKDADTALVQYNNALLALTNLSGAVPLDFRCLMLAPLVTSRPDISEAGLQATADWLGERLTQAQVMEAVEESKKNLKQN